MSNWFRMTADGRLDRVFLRSSAVWRCCKRYGATEQWAIEKLSEVMTPTLAQAVYDTWKQSIWFTNQK